MCHFASPLIRIYLLATNALLSSEARYTNASALLRNHKTHCKPKMPRVPNLLEQFVMFVT
ncbi:hypothetical protein D8T63_22440 [Vibrio vulnificus]|nr:hypothetical protein D8T63_22440 [Vibrio vulnificus]